MTTARTTGQPSVPVLPGTGRLRPLGLDEVAITEGFWADRQRVNRDATLGHIRSWLDREGWVTNFDLAATGGLPAGRRGREFSDSEVYKYLEALAWELGRSPDPVLEAEFRGLVARIGAAQEPDGYLNTQFGRTGQQPRWSALEWGHELYCLGHLFQAAVARVRTAPDADDGLLGIALDAADLVCDVFGADGIQSFCGHPEVETGLVELTRITGDPRYLEQARLFIERRGHGTLKDIEFGRAYYQDDVPVREATVLRGHAVRANYLSAGAVDVAVETADSELLTVLTQQWGNTVAHRTYLTGGQGSHHQDEAFGDDWVLPPDRAYSETCAAVGSVMFSWRLLLATGDPRYADLIERTLFNVVATSPAADGRSFFYANTLQRREPAPPVSMDEVSPRAASSQRAPWFEVSCCPPNVARTFASLAGYLATVDGSGIQLHQYASSSVTATLPDGRQIGFDVETAYPRDGVVRVTMLETTDGAWTLTLRVPAWAGSARVTVHSGRTVDSFEAGPGSVPIEREFAVGDVVELELPMHPRITAPDRHIDALRGTVAVERGPEVLCLETVDLAGLPRPTDRVDFGDLVIDLSRQPSERDGRVWVRLLDALTPADPWPYEPLGEVTPPVQAEGIEVPLIAYHDWAERGPSAMRVWIPTV
jgi:uncharacterized protein